MLCFDRDGRPQRRHHHHHSSLERKMIRENIAANNEIGSLAVIFNLSNLMIVITI